MDHDNVKQKFTLKNLVHVFSHDRSWSVHQKNEANGQVEDRRRRKVLKCSIYQSSLMKVEAIKDLTDSLFY